jgi:hypothetical protein
VGLTPAELGAYVGRFYSDELDATYEVTRAGNALVLRRARTPADTMRAVDRQTFRATGLTLRFTPAAQGTPSPMFTIDAGRARGIEFNRVTAAGK